MVGPTPQDMGSTGVCIGALVLVRGRQCHPSLHPNPRVGPAGYWTQAEPQTRAWQHPNPDSVDVLNFPWQPVDNDSHLLKPCPRPTRTAALRLCKAGVGHA